ncbi:MAG: hypothetical protein DLM70_01100 [Chloroflexi bacterium]|nr:MAG: hypothetical protein DLM70_01100 [Chloroflexota bacterium]
MPFKEVFAVDQRGEFCVLGSQEGVNIRELCRRYGISAPQAISGCPDTESRGVQDWRIACSVPIAAWDSFA